MRYAAGMTVLLVLSLLALGLALWNALAWPRMGRAATSAPAASVSILIPARDEETNIAACLESALAQGPAVAEALVYDDHSTDRTAALVEAAAARDARVRRLAPAPLPDGWFGKPFACARLADAARAPLLLFLDADARLRPGAVDRLLAEAVRREATFLSAWPGLDLVGAAERIFMPLLNFSVFTLCPAALGVRFSFPILGLAHGACILARADAYRAAGGHALVRAEVFEDTALARAWRRAGLRGLCLDGQDVVRVRMYDSFPAIWRGFEKVLRPAFRREISFWLFLAFHAAVVLLPFAAAPALALAGRPWTAPASAAAAVLAARAAQAARFRYPAWSVLLHPFAEAGLLALAATSWYKWRTGRGIAWKGRRYARPRA